MKNTKIIDENDENKWAWYVKAGFKGALEVQVDLNSNTLFKKLCLKIFILVFFLIKYVKAKGACLMVDGNVPHGSGLSSSSALVCCYFCNLLFREVFCRFRCVHLF